MDTMKLIRRSGNATELIHSISLIEVQEDGKLNRFLEEHNKVKLNRKKIGLEEKAKQTFEDMVKEMFGEWEEL